MKAVVMRGFGGPEVMEIADVATPEPGPNQVRVRVLATSVNRADIIQRQGHYPPPPGESDILGLEVAGRIDALGFGVSGWKLGDRVMGVVAGGGYAEYALVYADHLIPIPETMNVTTAACVSETYITAYLNVFMIGGFHSGQSVLLHGGGGGVNTAALQLCRALVPDGTIIVTASAGKLERGLDHNGLEIGRRLVEQADLAGGEELRGDALDGAGKAGQHQREASHRQAIAYPVRGSRWQSWPLAERHYGRAKNRPDREVPGEAVSLQSGTPSHNPNDNPFDNQRLLSQIQPHRCEIRVLR